MEDYFAKGEGPEQKQLIGRSESLAPDWKECCRGPLLLCQEFVSLFVQSESLKSFCIGYFLLVVVLLLSHVPVVGLILSFVVESVAAGWYLRVMQQELEFHGPAGSHHFALWPKLNCTVVFDLFLLGLRANMVQLAYALMAAALCLPVFASAILVVTVAKNGHLSGQTLVQMLFLSAIFTSPITLGLVIVMAPIALARFAHTRVLSHAFEFAFIYKSIAWGSGLIRGAAGLYIGAIFTNTTLVLFSPELMVYALEPFIEFTSMSLVCRFNARWYKQVISESNCEPGVGTKSVSVNMDC